MLDANSQQEIQKLKSKVKDIENKYNNLETLNINYVII